MLRGSEAEVPKTFPVVHVSTVVETRWIARKERKRRTDGRSTLFRPQFIDGTELLFPPFNFEEQKWGKRRLFTEATRVQVPLMLGQFSSPPRSSSSRCSDVDFVALSSLGSFGSQVSRSDSREGSS